MASSLIVIRQNDANQISGSRDDLVLNQVVTLINQNDAGVTTWLWLMIDKPQGSMASLTTMTASSSTFIPDVDGTYLIKLMVNNGAATDRKGAAVRTAYLDYRIPAASEDGEFDAVRGWATAVDFALQKLDDGYGKLLTNIPNDVVRSSRNILTQLGQLVGGGDLSADRTFGLASTGISAGTYAGITFDSFGRATAASIPVILNIPGIQVSSCSLVITGAGSGTQVYSIVAILANGNRSTAGPSASTAGSGPTTLDGAHYVDITITPVVGAITYVVLRTRGGTTMGRITPFAGQSELTLRDNGIAAILYSDADVATPSLQVTGYISGGSYLVDVANAKLATWTEGQDLCAGQTQPPCGCPPYPTSQGGNGNVPVFGISDSSREEPRMGGPLRLFSINYNATARAVSLVGPSDDNSTVYFGIGEDTHIGPLMSGCCEGGDFYVFGGGGNDEVQPGVDVAGKYGGRLALNGGHGGQGQGSGSVDIDTANPADPRGNWHPFDIAASGGSIHNQINFGICGTPSMLFGKNDYTTNYVFRAGSMTFTLPSICPFYISDGTVHRLNMDASTTSIAFGSNSVVVNSTGTVVNNILTASLGVLTSTITGSGGVSLIKNTTTYLDTGVSNDSNITIGANISLFCPAGTTGINFGNGTGGITLPTGSINYTGASTKTVSISTNSNGTLLIGGGNGSAATKIQDAAGNAFATFDETTGTRIGYTGNTLTLNASTATFSNAVNTPSISSATIGPNSSQQHTLPVVASSTIVVASANKFQNVYNNGASQTDSTLTVDNTRKGMLIDFHGNIAAITTPTVTPFVTDLAQLGFAVYDSTIPGGGSDTKSIYFGIGGSGEIVGTLTSPAQQSFVFRGDLDTIFHAPSKHIEGGEIIWYGGDGASVLGGRAGSFRAYGGTASAEAMAGGSGGGGIEFDTGPNPTGTGALQGAPGGANTQEDIDIGVNLAKTIRIGRNTTGQQYTRIMGNAIQNYTDGYGTFSVIDANSHTRFDLTTNGFISGLDRITAQTIDGYNIFLAGATVATGGMPGISLTANRVPLTFEASTTGAVITLSNYQSREALRVTSNTTVANNVDFFSVDNNGVSLIKAHTNAAGGDVFQVYGAITSDSGPLKVIALGTGGAQYTGAALTLDSATNARGRVWSVESLGEALGRSVTRYWLNAFRIVDVTSNAVRFTIGGDAEDGGGGEVAIGSSPPIATGALLQVQGAVSVAGNLSFATNASYDIGVDAAAPRRIRLSGTAPINTDFVLNSGWGTSPTVTSISGNDSHLIFTVTAKATTGANPTITYTFKNGTWTTAPFAMCKLEASSDVLTVPITETTSATQLIITYNGTPVANATYVFATMVIGT